LLLEAHGQGRCLCARAFDTALACRREDGAQSPNISPPRMILTRHRPEPAAAPALNQLPTFARLIMHKSAFPDLLAWLAAIAVHVGVVWLVAPPM
jgi:hypothetical protein